MTDKEWDYANRIYDLSAIVEQLRVDVTAQRQRAERAEAATKLRARMEDCLIEALEPLWQRARGADYVPDDATVTVFMKDCRIALDAIMGRSVCMQECKSRAA